MTDPSPGASIDLFISHASADDASVTRIHAALADAGIDAWVDHVDGLGPDDSWPKQIDRAAGTGAADPAEQSPG